MFRTLINQIPPHDTYIEAFLGAGSVMLNKRPAAINIGVELDVSVVSDWCHHRIEGSEKNNLTVFGYDALRALKIFQPLEKDVFLYCDPPYILSTRKSGPRYKYEFTDDQHRELLKLLTSLDCMVMVSGYRHAIYDDALINWRRIDYNAPTRHGLVNESAWMNYQEPTELHDYRYLGNDFREREKITRQTSRWVSRLRAMPILRRRAILAAILAENIDKDL